MTRIMSYSLNACHSMKMPSNGFTVGSNENARQCDMETNDALVGIYCKLEIYIIRFCLIIQLARWTCGECDKHTIDLESVNRAILLAEIFGQQP